MAQEAPARWRVALWPLLGAAGLFLLLHPYRGIEGDARLYVGRALADLDPAGIGRDLMFVHDGQSRFSLFPALLRGLVGALGPAWAALAVSLAGLAAWFTAAVALAVRLGGTGRWIVLAAVVVLPISYGHPGCSDWARPSRYPVPWRKPPSWRVSRPTPPGDPASRACSCSSAA